jgi:hypothetical protein
MREKNVLTDIAHQPSASPATNRIRPVICRLSGTAWGPLKRMPSPPTTKKMKKKAP